MEKKELYLSPATEAAELGFECLLCVSDPDDWTAGELPGFTF